MLSFKFIGWKCEGTSDKVWGVIYLEDALSTYNTKCLTFWGRRGAKLQTKLSQDDHTMWRIVESKKDSGYVEIDVRHLNTVYPGFEDDLEKTALWAALKL